MNNYLFRLSALFLALCLVADPTLSAGLGLLKPEPLLCRSYREQSIFAEEALAEIATQQLHAFNQLGEIIMGWTGKLCPAGPSGKEDRYEFDGWHPDPNSRSVDKQGESSSGAQPAA